MRIRRRISALPILAAAAFSFSPAIAEPASARNDFLKLIDRPRIPLSPRVATLPDAAGRLRYSFSFTSDSNQRVPGLILRKESLIGHRFPVVIALHGTGGNKEGQIPLLEQLASKGFLAVAIDGRYHGERAVERGKPATGSAAYNDAILRAWRTGEEHPFLYDTVWDIMRLIDYLITRRDVDGSRIGVIGFSKGGMEIYLAAAVDHRIRVAVPCIGVQSFAWALDNNSWQSRADTFRPALEAAAKEAGAQLDAAFLRSFYDRVAPGVYTNFDGPKMLPLIAPRPLMTINGGADARTPLPGLELCLDAARKAYAAAGVPEQFLPVIEQDVGHRVTPQALAQGIRWLLTWLQPPD
jgi:dienelactone hydrolase